MAVPNNPKVAKVTLVGNRDDREWVNTFHVNKPSGALTSADLNTIAEAAQTWWHNSYRNQFGGSIVLDQIQVRKLDPSDPLALDYTVGLPEGGTRTSGDATEEPANVSVAMSERTGLAGRKYRGRMYVPGIGTTDVTSDDRISTPAVVRLVGIISALISAYIDINFPLCIFHKADNTFTNVTSWVIDAILDSQRRRLPGRGR